MQAFSERVFGPRRSLCLGAVDAGFSAALWSLYNKTGIRPEWIVPVLASESGLNPAISNLQGYPYGGINQIAYSYLQARGIDPTTYLTWSASQQLNGVVTGYMQAQVAAFGPLRSGTRVYQSNFLPITLKTATSLDSVLAVKPAGGCGTGRTSNIYCANPGLDYTKKGTITVGDLAHFVGKQAALPYVKAVIANAYAAAPAGVGPETDPVYGLDFQGQTTTSAPSSWTAPLVLAGSAIAAMLLFEAYKRQLIFAH